MTGAVDLLEIVASLDPLPAPQGVVGIEVHLVEPRAIRPVRVGVLREDRAQRIIRTRRETRVGDRRFTRVGVLVDVDRRPIVAIVVLV